MSLIFYSEPLGFSSIISCCSYLPSSHFNIGSLIAVLSSQIKFNSYQISPNLSLTKAMLPLNFPTFRGMYMSSYTYCSPGGIYMYYSPKRPSPSINTSKVIVSCKGLRRSISQAIAFLRPAFRSKTLSAGGDSVFNRTVYQMYLPSASVKVILPVY